MLWNLQKMRDCGSETETVTYGIPGYIISNSCMLSTTHLVALFSKKPQRKKDMALPTKTVTYFITLLVFAMSRHYFLWKCFFFHKFFSTPRFVRFFFTIIQLTGETLAFLHKFSYCSCSIHFKWQLVSHHTYYYYCYPFCHLNACCYSNMQFVVCWSKEFWENVQTLQNVYLAWFC